MFATDDIKFLLSALLVPTLSFAGCKRNGGGAGRTANSILVERAADLMLTLVVGTLVVSRQRWRQVLSLGRELIVRSRRHELIQAEAGLRARLAMADRNSLIAAAARLYTLAALASTSLGQVLRSGQYLIFFLRWHRLRQLKIILVVLFLLRHLILLFLNSELLIATVILLSGRHVGLIVNLIIIPPFHFLPIQSRDR